MSHRMMCLTAHPDDESLAFGGALLMVRDQGADTGVICLTDGAGGSFRADACSGEELARLRRAEFEAAGKALGLTYAEVLHFRDGALYQENFYDLSRVFINRIRRHRPQVVLTFGGDGGVNMHRDHTVASLAATAAFHWAGRGNMFADEGAPYTPQKLYYSGTPFVSVHNSPEIAASARVPWSLVLNLEKWKAQKLTVFRLHTTQRGILERFDEERLELIFAEERYLLAASRDGGLSASNDALFAGVVED